MFVKLSNSPVEISAIQYYSKEQDPGFSGLFQNKSI